MPRIVVNQEYGRNQDSNENINSDHDDRYKWVLVTLPADSIADRCYEHDDNRKSNFSFREVIGNNMIHVIVLDIIFH